MFEKKINEIIKNAFTEDLGESDITTEATIPKSLKAKGVFIVKQNGVVAGFEIVKKVFEYFDKDLVFEKLFNDGDKVQNKTIVATVEGKASSILTCERTALNFFQRMSGIATSANLFAEKIKHTKAKIVDTRKTVPGLRIIDKMAVNLSGCSNHRFGLYDMFLIKDNHIAAAGSITKAINACKDYNKQNDKNFKIEVETTNLKEVEEALSCNPDIIMLDNFEISEMQKAVKLINNRCQIEASGMVNIDTVKEIAETGVDFISVGALTHSVKALDISLEITNL